MFSKIPFLAKGKKQKKAKQKRHLFVLAFIMFINALSYGILIPLIYPYASKLGITPSGLSLMVLTYSLFQFLATPVIGRLSDRYGRKPLLLICLLGTSISLAFFAMATTLWALFLARMLDGITGGNNSVAQASVADVTDGPERAKSFGILGAAFGFGFLFGPAIGGLMGQINLSAPLWFASGLAFFGVILGLFFMEETLHTKKEISKEPLFNFKKLFNGLVIPPTGSLFVLTLISAVAQGIFIIGVQTYSYDVLEMSGKTFGILLGVAGIVNIIMQAGMLKFLIKWFQSKEKLIVYSFAGSTIAMFSLFFTHTISIFIIVMLIYMIFFSIQTPLISGLISEETKDEDQGGAMGLSQSYMSLGMIIGPLIMSLVVSIDIAFAFIASAIVFLLGLIVTKSLFVTNAKKLDL